MTPTQIGFLQSSNALAQLFAVPIIGALSDKYGRRPMLILCVIGTLISFLILAMANSTFWVFFSRILDGLIGGNISLAHAYVTDITDKNSRSMGMGIIGGAFGLGFVIGPALGGFLVSYHHQAPSLMAAFVTFLNLVSVMFFLPESLPPQNRKKDMSSIKETVKDLFNHISRPKMAKLLWLRFVYLIVFTLFEQSFGFFNQLGENTPRVAGMLLCWFGIMYSIIQAGGLRILQKYVDEDVMLSRGLLVLAVFYLLYSMNATSLWQFVALIPLGLASGLVNTLINSKVSKEVDNEHIGGTLGVSAALGSMTRMVASPAAGFFVEKFGSGTPFVGCSVLAIYLWVFFGTIFRGA